ncbi:MAG: hypothetical protein JO131_07685, partial [Gammaproteobacteria bacterium]|nr:hypothetical protein [Gammaproteobacteria bacterium]
MGLSRDQTENSGNKEPVKFGYEAISNTGKCGMPENHMKAMMLSAQESESIIMIRPVSPAAAEFISGGASTKDFDIKTKSTKEVSPFVGLLVVDPNFSGTIKVITEKLDGKQENSHDKYTAGVKDAFNKNKKHTPKDEEPSLIEMPATISKERMENLMAQVNSKGQKLFSVVEDYQNGEDPEIKKITWEKDVIERKETEKDKFTETITKTQITAYAKPDVNNPSMMAFFSDEQCTKPITVLGKNIINKENNKEQRPVTADYDLFAVVPKWKSVNQEISGDSKAEWAGDMKAPDVTVGQSNMESLRKAPIDKRPFRTQGDYTANQREVQNTAVRNEKLEASLKAKEERVNTNKIKEINPSLSPPSPAPKEDDLQGNVSLRVQSTINIINKNIQIQDKNRQGTQGLNMVHHNDEGHNPFADSLKDNLPILIFLPPDPKIKLNLQEGKENQPMLVQSVEDLKYIREKLQEAGYYWSTHGRFKKELPAFREEGIGEIKKEIEDKW